MLEIVREQMAAVFNEWSDRYAQNPGDFKEILDSEGRPFADYGESCAAYFARLCKELQSQGRLGSDLSIEIGERLVRKVFEAGRDQDREVSRIAFKTGHTNRDGTGEQELGGLCESALASVLMAGLQEIFGGGDQ